MPWHQYGKVFESDGGKAWSRSHTQTPSALVLQDRIRVYYATRNAENRSVISFADFDRQDPTRLIAAHDAPVLTVGEPGTHDEDGVIAGCLIDRGDRLFMYYTGISRGGNVPYRMAVGLAVSRDGGVTFERMFEGPVVDRSRLEPHMTMAPNVLKTKDGWRMWYGSGIKWVWVEDKFEPVYVIKTATSADGETWLQPNVTSLTQAFPREAITRPAFLPTSTGFEMWYCHRDSENYRDGAGSYRLGYATSTDGVSWVRESDPPELAPSGEGWNSVAMAYCSVVVVDGRKVMYHNGDGFGRTGFGCAIWSDAA